MASKRTPAEHNLLIRERARKQLLNRDTRSIAETRAFRVLDKLMALMHPELGNVSYCSAFKIANDVGLSWRQTVAYLQALVKIGAIRVVYKTHGAAVAGFRKQGIEKLPYGTKAKFWLTRQLNYYAYNPEWEGFAKGRQAIPPEQSQAISKSCSQKRKKVQDSAAVCTCTNYVHDCADGCIRESSLLEDKEAGLTTPLPEGELPCNRATGEKDQARPNGRAGMPSVSTRSSSPGCKQLPARVEPTQMREIDQLFSKLLTWLREQDVVDEARYQRVMSALERHPCHRLHVPILNLVCRKRVNPFRSLEGHGKGSSSSTAPAPSRSAPARPVPKEGRPLTSGDNLDDLLRDDD